MTGGEGSLIRGAAKTAAAGPQGPSKRYPAQRKAKKESPATGPHGASKGLSSAKRKAAKDPASRRTPLPRRKAKDVETGDDDAAAAAGAAPGEEERFRRLSEADVAWILSLTPTKPPARFAALRRGNPALTPRPGEEADEARRRLYRLARAFYEMEESLPATQAWVRGELKEKGYVEVGAERARRRAEVQAVIDREWPAIEEKMKSLVLSEKEYRKEYQGEGGEERGSDDSDDGEGSDGSQDEEEDELCY